LDIFVVGSAARNQALSREQALRTVSLSETCIYWKVWCKEFINKQ